MGAAILYILFWEMKKKTRSDDMIFDVLPIGQQQEGYPGGANNPKCSHGLNRHGYFLHLP